MIKKVKKQNQNKTNVASHWVLPFPMWLSEKKVYIAHEAADSSPTHKHAGGLGQGQVGDTAARPGPLPSRGRGGSEAAGGGSGVSGSPADLWHGSAHAWRLKVASN